MTDTPTAWLRERCDAEPPPDAVVITILGDDGRIVGLSIFSHWLDGGRDAELTLEMDRPASPALIRKLLNYAFSPAGLGVERLTMHPRTEQSRRLAERVVGAVHEGTRRGEAPRSMYGLTLADYLASPLRRSARS